MMDSKDVEAEIHPLKNEDGESQENLGNQTEKEDSFKKNTPPQSRLSRCRTVAFFLSIFTCLFVIFIVSFIIPCPERPVSQRTWRISYNTAVAYNFMAMEDINRDRIQDVLFLYKNVNSSNNPNGSCGNDGVPSPCTVLAAVSGANGSVLWEMPVAQDVALVECAVPQPQDSGASSACVLVGVSGSFTAVSSLTGAVLWSRSSSFGGNASVLSPLLHVPDGDGDGTPDLLVLTREGTEVSGYLHSGGTGLQIGRRGSLGLDGESGALLHVTRTGAHYVLLPCASSLCGCSLKRLYEEVTGRGSLLRTDPVWESRVGTGTPLLSSGAVRHLMHIPGKTGPDVLLVSSNACELLDGQGLTRSWAIGTAQVLRKPTLGHYTPDTVAVVIENGTGVDRQVLLLDLRSGAVLWSQALWGHPGSPRSASLLTADGRSAFFFWGLHIGENQTDARGAPHRLYMFHPSLPAVLLELANISAGIAAVEVVLLEPSRHAACILLTGPAGPAAPGLVSVAKHKVRDLVPGGRVVRLGAGGPESDQAVRDHFSRLRYRSAA
ncbi:protein FAM234A [Dasypus novemcinctus]|uniref:protein FAM234A n=1 Tax=Dasypus novemcinctus TaxID=9361 RepID=UPI00265F58E2|nr:protein FAM234A [Dasypus novemcinctus]XP_058141594.1 protein FAM234A [Dasypus novemcinctus]XP_058141595.1 protein FAM234A [Dasypus novemcinctus]XP_058141596.1 protein FAM234A [Dasypus novemcinctus]XP_058141597.1 protein FAM234A [Dasypus novemcinctus]XP_058141598.1 protein FAM234A [Dasypus novemcinctus]XP_058141599.1 protein FAM234A [Dasypus novemcinctus]XP_058141600.1 protein FAM234A [Dasypus novemcinctus]XP_058141601.1 protein FAM234A [Dasypus novemcinctus]